MRATSRMNSTATSSGSSGEPGGRNGRRPSSNWRIGEIWQSHRCSIVLPVEPPGRRHDRRHGLAKSPERLLVQGIRSMWNVLPEDSAADAKPAAENAGPIDMKNPRMPAQDRHKRSGPLTLPYFGKLKAPICLRGPNPLQWYSVLLFVTARNPARCFLPRYPLSRDQCRYAASHASAASAPLRSAEAGINAMSFFLHLDGHRSRCSLLSTQ